MFAGGMAAPIVAGRTMRVHHQPIGPEARADTRDDREALHLLQDRSSGSRVDMVWLRDPGGGVSMRGSMISGFRHGL